MRISVQVQYEKKIIQVRSNNTGRVNLYVKHNTRNCDQNSRYAGGQVMYKSPRILSYEFAGSVKSVANNDS